MHVANEMRQLRDSGIDMSFIAIPDLYGEDWRWHVGERQDFTLSDGMGPANNRETTPEWRAIGLQIPLNSSIFHI